MATIEERTDKLEKSVSEIERKSNRLENFKAFATIVSSLIIAGAGIWVTERYNYKQLEVAQRQSDAQTTIARDKELVDLILKLGSSDAKARTISAASLSLYGKDAVPPLIATLGDSNNDVNEAVSKALVSIGKDSVPDLIRAFKDKRSDDDIKSAAIYILGELGSPDAFDLALSALSSTVGSWNLRESAATTLGLLKDKRATAPLIILLLKLKDSDARLLENIVWALGEIGDPTAYPYLKDLLNNQSVGIRIRVISALAKIDKTAAIETLSQLQKTDKNKEVLKNAADRIFMLQNGLSVEENGPSDKGQASQNVRR